MIITMVKRRSLALLPLAAGLAAAFPAHAAWDFTPMATARATYSDNVTLRADDQAESGMVLQLTPGFQLARSASISGSTTRSTCSLIRAAGPMAPSATART